MPLIRKDAPAKTVSLDEQSGDVLAKLTTGTVDERWAAARSIGEAEEGESAVQHLQDALALEADARVREALFTSLAHIGGSASVAVMIQHLRSDDANLRTGALDALRTMPDAVRAVLPDLLADPEPDVRLLACEILRSFPGNEATILLSDLLMREQQANVCAAAVDVLAEVGFRQAVPALRQCVERFPDDPFLSFSIGLAIEQVRAQDTDLGG